MEAALREIREGTNPVSEASVKALAAIELGVPDLDAAASFYENVWGLSPVARVGDTCYLRAAGPDYFVLALHRSDEPCLVRVRLSGQDRQTVDAVAERVMEAGGALLHAPCLLETPGGGYGFGFRDPEGREFQVVCGVRTHAPVTGTNDRPCRLSHVVLNSLDFDRASQFMRDALGFRLRDRTAKGIFLGCNADHHCIAFTNRRNSLLSHVAYELPNLDSVLRGCGRLKRAGLTIEWGIGRHGTGDNVFAYYIDPDGFAIEYTTEMQQIDDSTYVPGSPETNARAAHADVWGYADPPSSRFLQALHGPGASKG
jgi:catechol 2,3-dioxygenase-like lactoylglutathione lyase family enzyme